MSEVPVAETTLGPALPTLTIGAGSEPLVYLPGLSLHPGLPKGQERSMALSGWDPLVGRYTIYRIGRRVRPVGTTFADMAADVVAAIEQLGGPVDLMGASTGGMIALHVAAVRPDLVRRLVLVISGPRMSPSARRMSERVRRAASAGRWRSVFATILPIGATSPLGRTMWAGFGWLLGPRLIGVPTDPTMMLAELAAWEAADVEQILGRVTCPTLVIGTALDPVFPPATVRSLAEGLPDASLVIAPGLAHDFPADANAVHVLPFLTQERQQRDGDHRL